MSSLLSQNDATNIVIIIEMRIKKSKKVKESIKIWSFVAFKVGLGYYFCHRWVTNQRSLIFKFDAST